MTLKAIAFWNDVYTAFPSERVYNWMNAIANDKADWFRNYSLTRIAISENSKRNGFYSQALYDKNLKRLAAIEAKHQELIGQMQW